MLDRDRAEAMIRTAASMMRERGYKPTRIVVPMSLMGTLGEPVFFDGMKIQASLDIEDGQFVVL
jgi:hypothetical protein